MTEAQASSAAARGGAPRKSGDTLADKLARLGVDREEDLVLHLPLRYEDHTRLVPLARVKVGETLQTEGTVVDVDIAYRPRRQLVCRIEEVDERGGRAGLTLRFFSFYPNQQKALELGATKEEISETICIAAAINAAAMPAARPPTRAPMATVAASTRATTSDWISPRTVTRTLATARVSSPSHKKWSPIWSTRKSHPRDGNNRLASLVMAVLGTIKPK